jgi:hypothetical protein
VLVQELRHGLRLASRTSCLAGWRRSAFGRRDPRREPCRPPQVRGERSSPPGWERPRAVVARHDHQLETSVLPVGSSDPVRVHDLDATRFLARSRHPARKPQNQAKTVAVGCDRLARRAQGKGRVDTTSLLIRRGSPSWLRRRERVRRPQASRTRSESSTSFAPTTSADAGSKQHQSACPIQGMTPDESRHRTRI